VRDFQQAADTTSQLLKAHPDDPQRIFDQSQSEYYVGYIQWHRGRLHEAEAAFRRYLDMAERMNNAKPGDHGWQLENVYAKTNVAIVLTELGRPSEAVELLTRARAEMAQIAHSHPEDSVSYGNTIGWEAIALAAQGRHADAIKADEDKIAAASGAPNADKDQDAQFLIANAHHEIAAWQRDLGHSDDATASARRALDELLILNKREPANLDNVAEIVSTRTLLGALLADSGNREAARQQLRLASEGLASLLKRPIPRRMWRVFLNGRIAELRAQLADSEGDRNAALGALADYLSDVHRYQAEGSEVTDPELPVVAGGELARGDLLARSGLDDRAQELWRSAAKRLRASAERLNPQAMTLLAQLDLRLGNAQDAHAWADRVLGTTYRHPTFADLQQRLGPTQQAGGAARP
jgi:tetratricopeptide (TPR) repeat protein